MLEEMLKEYPEDAERLTVDELKEILEITKQYEKQAADERVMAEQMILDHKDIKPNLPKDGSKKIGPFEISCGVNEKWDQQKLFLKAREIKSEFFPFDLVYKKNTKKAKAIAEVYPDLWAQLKEALTTTPKKTSVTIVKEKVKA